jgi:hypothetical protein
MAQQCQLWMGSLQVMKTNQNEFAIRAKDIENIIALLNYVFVFTPKLNSPI